jgi:flagellar hook-length control protein FliK
MMRTDAMLFSLTGSKVMQNPRMDRAAETNRKGPATEFGNTQSMERAEKPKFQETYDRIARANESARKSADRCAPEHRSVQQRNPRSDDTEWETSAVTSPDQATTVWSEQIPQGETVDGSADAEADQSPMVDPAQREQAETLIRQVLAELTSALGLEIDVDLKELSLDTITSGTVEQFAEMLYALKNIAGMLDTSASQGQPIELATMVLDVARMNELQQLVRSATFRIEIGLSTLGISQEVASRLAAKLDLPLTNGIPQAMNPALLQMPEMQVRQVFGAAVSDPQKEIAALIQRVAGLLKENGGSQQQFQVQVTGTSATLPRNPTADLSSLDSSVMRGVLKIAPELAIQANTEAAETASKLELPQFKGQLAAKALEGLVKAAEAEQVPMGDGVMRMPGAGAQVQDMKSTGHVTRTPDESVINQIADRLHGAVRSGITEVRVQLRPESLGEVQMRIRMEGDVVVARIQVESQQVKQIVESNLQSLRDSLAQQNLTCGSFEVNVGNGWSQGMEQSFEQQTAQQNGAVNPAAVEPSHDDNAVAGLDMTHGRDTGKRYGSNTVEYFA